MTITYRPTTPDDTSALFAVFSESVTDLGARLGSTGITGGDDPDFLAGIWERRRPLWEHLQQTAVQSWLAEDDGKVLGYARSVLRDDVLELTEFFVLPGQQSAGVGRELLSRAFPAEGARRRFIIATLDTRALARYMKTSVYPCFPICYLSRDPEPAVVETDLTFEPITPDSDILAALDALDASILGYKRTVDHQWLMQNRAGFICRRAGEIVGYGYVSVMSGPFALRDANDYPAVLAYSETQAFVNSYRFGLDIPMTNRTAIAYLLSRGYQLDSFFEFFMSDEPFGQFENYIFTSPPLFA